MFGQEIVTVRPAEIDDVLVNPGIGFMTFHVPNGGPINPENTGYPQTSIDYLRVYWNFFEPVRGQYRWDVMDAALKAAHDKGKALMFRIMPYGAGPGNEVPEWYREMVGPEPERLDPSSKVRTDPEDPRYIQYFGGMVREIGRRYDGHPDLESVDLSIVGPRAAQGSRSAFSPQVAHTTRCFQTRRMVTCSQRSRCWNSWTRQGRASATTCPQPPQVYTASSRSTTRTASERPLRRRRSVLATYHPGIPSSLVPCRKPSW